MGLVWKIISNDVERKILQKRCLGSSSSSELVDVFGGKQGVLLGRVACGPALCVQSSQWRRHRRSQAVKDIERWPERVQADYGGGDEQKPPEWLGTRVAPATWLNSPVVPDFAF